MGKTGERIDEVVGRISNGQSNLRDDSRYTELVGLVIVNGGEITTTSEFQGKYFSHGKETQIEMLEDYANELEKAKRAVSENNKLQ